MNQHVNYIVLESITDYWGLLREIKFASNYCLDLKEKLIFEDSDNSPNDAFSCL